MDKDKKKMIICLKNEEFRKFRAQCRIQIETFAVGKRQLATAKLIRILSIQI